MSKDRESPRKVDLELAGFVRKADLQKQLKELKQTLVEETLIKARKEALFGKDKAIA